MATATGTTSVWQRRLRWRDAVGAVLRERRLDAGLRLTDVSARAGVSTQYLSEIERGRKEPSSEVLAAVTDALDLSLADLALRVADLLAPRPGRLPARAPAVVLDLTGRHDALVSRAPVPRSSVSRSSVPSPAVTLLAA
ncbi:helix-turn-helix domain-containing protein [Cellulomonas sp. DKR-3]|uniref:Helix-turn-helix domain-containing protein n=1 Tax=Cellulomonas fulva TaxID=2835530 RepID=A0ABS5TXB4_9CELL|nr:helix-turn-helix transcriptional regulator [Cellulomonas fulva]MBT0993732.1 helix-turn-helix domain-containing protein [Cellulomonas fulva]